MTPTLPQQMIAVAAAIDYADYPERLEHLRAALVTLRDLYMNPPPLNLERVIAAESSRDKALTIAKAAVAELSAVEELAKRWDRIAELEDREKAALADAAFWKQRWQDLDSALVRAYYRADQYERRVRELEGAHTKTLKGLQT